LAFLAKTTILTAELKELWFFISNNTLVAGNTSNPVTRQTKKLGSENKK
jgi:hypothetical protein